MINIIFSTMFYPVAIGKYFMFALQRREDVNLFTTGPYTGTLIPWKGGIHLPPEYAHAPDLPLPTTFCGNTRVIPTLVEGRLPFKPDLWINVDAGFGFLSPSCQYAVIATDPHVLTYDYQRTQADKFYNMQKFYSKAGDIYLPYCADPVWHSPLVREKEYDVCLVGLQYDNRTRLVNRLRAKGLKVYYDTGPCYDEYQELYAKSKIAISWSSKQDLIARVFEAFAIDIPLVCNKVPDMDLFFEDGTDYYGFTHMEQAEAQIHMALANYEDAKKVSANAHKKVMAEHLYEHRIEQILKDFNLI